jgi:hypothetical protein
MIITRRGFLGVTAAGAVLRAQDAPRTVFRVKVDMVVLSFQVTDNKGHYVNGLQPKDFKIFEDGILQSISTFAEGAHGGERGWIDAPHRGRQQGRASRHGQCR